MRYWFPLLLICLSAHAQMGLRDPGYVAKLYRTSGGPFSPTNISSLKLWVKADQITATNTQMISQWDDLSGNNYHLTQSNSTYQMVYYTNIVNGKPAVQTISGATRFFYGGLTNTTDDMTVFIVFKFADTLINYMNLMAFFKDSTSNDYDDINNLSVGDWRVSPTYIGDYRNNALRSYKSGTPTANSSIIYCSAWANGTNTVYWNGTAQTSVTQSGNFGYQHFYVGTRRISGAPSVSTIYTRGGYCEILIWDKELTASEISSVHSYLNGRWAIY